MASVINCKQVSEQISAYFDKELRDDDERAIEAHLGECAVCRTQLDALRSMSRFVRDTPIAPPAELWDKISTARSNDLISPHRRHLRTRAAWLALATAASIMLVGWLIYRSAHSEADHGKMATVFATFFDEYDRNPESANQVFLASYAAQPVDGDEASKILGGPSISRFATLAGGQLSQRHLISMPCCRCVQSVYARKDGRPLIIFEHTNPQPEWFAHQSIEEVACPEGMVCKVDVDHGKASVITLNLGSHHATLVGARGVDEARAILREIEPGT